jgi:outer membrane PBP1 activator LpoA protein
MNEQQLQGLANHLNQSRAEFVTALQMVSDVLTALNENIKDFRGFLDATLERVQEHYEGEWLASAARLVEAQEKFSTSAESVVEITEFLNKRVQSCDDIWSAQLDMITKHNESAQNILEIFPKFFMAFTETNANTEATNRKLDALVEKMESYFGSGTTGLEFDN